MLSVGDGVVDRDWEVAVLGRDVVVPLFALAVPALPLDVLERPAVLGRVAELREAPELPPDVLLRKEVVRELLLARGEALLLDVEALRPDVPVLRVGVLLPLVLRELVPLRPEVPRVPLDVLPIDPCRYCPVGVAICPWRSPPMPARS